VGVDRLKVFYRQDEIHCSRTIEKEKRTQKWHNDRGGKIIAMAFRMAFRVESEQRLDKDRNHIFSERIIEGILWIRCQTCITHKRNSRYTLVLID
jgi:hypothetical protein